MLYKRLAGLDFPEDTPKNVLAALANGLMVKIGLVGDELETYASRMDGYLYEGRDERLKRIAELHILSDWLMQAYERIANCCRNDWKQRNNGSLNGSPSGRHRAIRQTIFIWRDCRMT